MEQHLRIARPTNDLARSTALYRDGLGPHLISSFGGHGGLDGVMLGHPGLPYHLEFTQQDGHRVPGAPSRENLLVFYFPSHPEWESACIRAKEAGFLTVESHNPYWDRDGRTFEDFEGYRIVLQNATWQPDS